MESGDFLEESLWFRICRQCEKPEISEISSLIGRGLIETNNLLWHEIMTMRSILEDVTSLDNDRFFRTVSGGEGKGIPLDRLMSPMSTLTGSNSTNFFHNTSPDTARSNDSTLSHAAALDTTEFVSSIRHWLTVGKISNCLTDIRAAFIHEKQDLEIIMNTLTKSVDGEVDTMQSSRTLSLSSTASSSPSSSCPNCRQETDSNSNFVPSVDVSGNLIIVCPKSLPWRALFLHRPDQQNHATT